MNFREKLDGLYTKEDQMPKPSPKRITDPLAILDALRGSPSGDYEIDLARMEANGVTCTEVDYDYACQINDQP